MAYAIWLFLWFAMCLSICWNVCSNLGRHKNCNLFKKWPKGHKPGCVLFTHYWSQDGFSAQHCNFHALSVPCYKLRWNKFYLFCQEMIKVTQLIVCFGFYHLGLNWVMSYCNSVLLFSFSVVLCLEKEVQS